jgi:prophage antirepressor-like protein
MMGARSSKIKIEHIHYESRSIRLVLVDDRWWVFAENAATQISAQLSPEKLFNEAPDSERRRMHLAPGPPVRLVSARYLIRRLRKSDHFDHVRFRAWLKAWKIVSGHQDLSDRA